MNEYVHILSFLKKKGQKGNHLGLNLKIQFSPGLVVLAFNLSTLKAEASRFLWVQDQPGLYIEFQYQNKIKHNKVFS